jgi:hypothetical protein
MAYLIYLFMIILEWYILILYSNQVLIKLDQLKLLKCLEPVHYKAFAFILFPTLAEYDKCSPLL